jgi:hypothetical protein
MASDERLAPSEAATLMRAAVAMLRADVGALPGRVTRWMFDRYTGHTTVGGRRRTTIRIRI